MECQGCRRENRAGSRFCDACGGALAVRCSACDRELSPDARFCNGCGTSAAAGGAPTQAPVATPSDSDAVRKTVTVLFCDLVGSTAFAESVDTESAREAMGRYHAMAKSVIESNGGTVAKFIGDGVMALFGVPEVAEDDADRAVAAGAALQRGFEPVRDHIGTRYGVEVGLRVGINTGEVVIDDNDADLVGDVLNTAARLESACTPGQVLVGEETWRLTRSTVGYEPLVEVTAKGKRDGLATFQLVLADDGSGFAIGGFGQPDSTPFIGRDNELGRLRALFDETLAISQARLATVIGSPGVGKTRLARELGNATSGAADIVEIRCERAGTATFAPVVDLLQQVAGLDDGDTPERIVAALRDLVGGESDADRVVELLGGFVGTARPRSTEDAFFGVRRLVEMLGSRRPLVLVIDDIQWAEPLFLDLLEHLAEWSKAAPVLIVGLARPELREIRPALTETGRRVALVVSLDGLDAAATELLAAELLGGGALPAELTAKLPSSTDGNPLFVRELIRMLVDDGVLAQLENRWELAVDLDAVEVPPTIQSLLATRVERLPPVERRVLERASVIGPEFPLGALVELVPEIGRRDLEVVLERLRRKEQVEPTGTYWGDEPIVRFHHVLIRDAAYRRLLKGARAELHLRVGDWMDRTASGLVGEFEVATAYHFEQARLYRRQLGDDDAITTEAGKRAAGLLHVAATRALERDDLSAAAGLSRRAIECLAEDADSLSELLVLACESVLSAGDTTTGVALVKRLGGRAQGDARLAAWATCFTAQLAVMTDPTGLQQATEQTEEAAAQFETLGDRAGLAKARIVRAGALARLGQVGAAETELDLALTAARAANDRRRITTVLSSAPVAALWGPSPVARAGGRCLDVMRLSRITADSPAVVATSSRCQAVLEAMRGRFETARSLLDASRTTSLELGLDHGLLETSLYAGIVELLADDPAAAVPHLRDAFGGLGQLGIGADAGQAAAHLARALLLQGHLGEADDLATESYALAGQNLQTAITARSAQAEILTARGDVGRALALADEAVRLATGTDLVFDHANALSTLARVRAAAGDDGGAHSSASAARKLFAQKGATVSVELTAGASKSTPFPAETASNSHAQGSPAEPSDEPWNEADRLFRKNTQLLTSGDLEAWEAMLDDDVRGADLRSGVRMIIENRADVVEQMKAVGETMGPMSCDVTTIAARGDDLVLSEMNWTRRDDPTGPRLDSLVISRWSGGLQLIKIVFETDDLRAAIAELDRLYLDTLDPSDGAEEAFNLRFMKAIRVGDLDQIMRFCHPSLVVADHHLIGWGHDSRFDDFRERMRTLTENSDSQILLMQREWRRSSTQRCHSNRLIATTAGAGQLVNDHLIVASWEPATGLTIRIDQFADGEFDEAFACFDAARAEIDAVIPAPNTAVRTGGVANARARTASLDEFLALFADDFTATLTDSTTVTLDDLRTGTVEPRALGYGVVDRRIMSVLTDRLAMLYVGFDDGTGHWSVEEVDDTGHLQRVRQFASIAKAANAIEDRWEELDVDDVSATVLRANRAMRNREEAAMRALLADEFRVEDHRPLGFPASDRDGFLATFAWGPDALDVMVVQCVSASSARAQVWKVAAITDSTSGHLWESVVNLSVLGLRDGLLTSFELFPEDDLDAATARFHELDGSAPALSEALPTPDDEPWNDADRWMRRAIDLRSADRFDEWAACLDDDVVWVSHRSLTGGSYRGRSEVSHAYTDQPVSMSAETMGVRGDSLVLQRHVWIYRDQDFEFEFLLLTRWSTEGLLTEAAVYDLTALRAAFDQLDAWYIEDLSPLDAAQLQATLTYFDAANDRDLARALSTLAPYVVSTTHRAISWGELDRAGVAAGLATITGYDGEALFTNKRVELAGPTGVLLDSRLQFTDRHGGDLVDRFVTVKRLLPASGLIAQMDHFQHDQEHLARALAGRWAAETIADPMVNNAVVAGGLANTLARCGEPGDVLCLLADDFTATLIDGTTVTLGDLRSGTVDPATLGYGVTQRETIAVLGDRLALTRIENSHWSVEQIDEHDRIVRVTLFEQCDLHAATNTFEQTALETSAADVVPESIRQWLDAHRNSDVVGQTRLTHDDFTMVDHRPLGYGTMDREDGLALFHVRDEDETLRGAPVYSVIHAANEDACVLAGSMWTLGGAGDYWIGLAFIGVYGSADGKLRTVNLFAEDDLAAALAYFDEMPSRRGPPAPSGLRRRWPPHAIDRIRRASG